MQIRDRNAEGGWPSIATHQRERLLRSAGQITALIWGIFWGIAMPTLTGWVHWTDRPLGMVKLGLWESICIALPLGACLFPRLGAWLLGLVAIFFYLYFWENFGSKAEVAGRDGSSAGRFFSLTLATPAFVASVLLLLATRARLGRREQSPAQDEAATEATESAGQQVFRVRLAIWMTVFWSTGYATFYTIEILIFHMQSHAATRIVLTTLFAAVLIVPLVVVIRSRLWSGVALAVAGLFHLGYRLLMIAMLGAHPLLPADLALACAPPWIAAGLFLWKQRPNASQQ